MSIVIHVDAGLTLYAARKARRRIAHGCLQAAFHAVREGRSTRNLPVLVCDARTRKGTPCKSRCTAGELRCRLHGGRSTGPKTDAGKERQKAGAAAYHAKRKQGKEAESGK